MPRRAVALDEVLEQLGPDRPAAADVGVVGGHVLEPLGRAVGHQDDGASLMPPRRRHGARGRARPAASGRPGRSAGSTPWPRLKMWPGRPPARSSTSSAASSTRSHGPSSTAGSRLPCTPRSSPTACPAVVERDAPVEADHVAARGRHRARAASPSRCRSGSSARRPRRGSAPSTARRTPRSRPARARRPTSRRAGSRPRRRSTCAGDVRRERRPRASPSARATSRGSRYISAFTRAKSRLGRPSTR